MFLIVFLFSILWAMSLGHIEARADHITNKYDKPKHIYYSVSRFMVIMMMLLLSQSLIFILSIILVFPFFHDGMYYISRNKLAKKKIYNKGWFSNGTTALFDKLFPSTAKIIFAIIGIVIQILLLLQIVH